MRPRSFRTTFSQASALVADVLDVQRVEREPARLHPVVVAADAVSIEAGPLRGSSGRRRGGGLRLQPTDGTAGYG